MKIKYYKLLCKLLSRNMPKPGRRVTELSSGGHEKFGPA